MKTALDTNVLSAIWTHEVTASALSEKLAEAQKDGVLVICGTVFAESLASPVLDERTIRNFLRATGIQIDSAMTESSWSEAGRRYARYIQRKRKHSKEAPKRMLADFIVGTHALIEADRLMTLDKNRYRTDFPELILL